MINTQKSTVLLDSNITQLEIEIKKTMPNKKITPFTTALKWKYLGINITKYVHNLYAHL